MRIWRGSICRNPTGGSRAATRPEDYHRPTPQAGRWTRSFGWRVPAQSAKIEWCGTTTVSSSWSARVGTTRRPKARWWWWCAKRRTGAWPSNTGAALCAGSRSRRPPSREARRLASLATPDLLRHRAWRSGSGRPRRITPGDGRRADER